MAAAKKSTPKAASEVSVKKPTISSEDKGLMYRAIVRCEDDVRSMEKEEAAAFIIGRCTGEKESFGEPVAVEAKHVSAAMKFLQISPMSKDEKIKMLEKRLAEAKMQNESQAEQEKRLPGIPA